jgi:2-polyprenyl-3-methyl-5-hydroxy-6-metoxy-1,4-benzoquinol methylase
MPTHYDAAWDRSLGADSVAYGPDIPGETELRLLGDLKGKRVLDLGCGAGSSSIAVAKQGAIAIAVDASADNLALAKRASDENDVRVEFHQADLADLAFVRADTVDLVLSVWALAHVEDLNRVFRQVHRVMKPNAPFVFSLPHPAYDLIDDDAEEPQLIRRSYFDTAPVHYEAGNGTTTDYGRTISELITGLVRANFRVDWLHEPEPALGGHRSPFWRDTFTLVPRTLIIRARKEGI